MEKCADTLLEPNGFVPTCGVVYRVGYMPAEIYLRGAGWWHGCIAAQMRMMEATGAVQEIFSRSGGLADQI